MWTWVSGGRRGGMNWEIGIDIYTLPGVKQVACGNLQITTLMLLKGTNYSINLTASQVYGS